MWTWMDVWKWLFAILALVFFTGCSVIDTGPNTAKAAVEGATGVAKVIMTSYTPKSVAAGAQANINDPTYRVHMFVGAGTVCDLTMALQGVDGGFDIQSTGEGVEIPPEMKKEILSIMGQHGLSEEERRDQITSVVLEWLAGKVGSDGNEVVGPSDG